VAGHAIHGLLLFSLLEPHGFLTYGFAKISWVVFAHPLIRRGHKFIYRHSGSNLAEPQTGDLKS
jgi:hypothetical protein